MAWRTLAEGKSSVVYCKESSYHENGYFNYCKFPHNNRSNKIYAYLEVGNGDVLSGEILDKYGRHMSLQLTKIANKSNLLTGNEQKMNVLVAGTG